MIVITVETGMVDEVLTDNPELLSEDIIVVDYDYPDCTTQRKTRSGKVCGTARRYFTKASTDFIAEIVRKLKG